MTQARPLPAEPTIRQLVAYGLVALPLAALTLPFYVIVPEFYTRDLGLPLASVGFALLLVRLVDALSDPVAGILADRFRPAFGRRRLWVMLSAPLVAIAALFVMVPPQNVTIQYLFIWACALSLSWTALQVPYYAWGAELSRTYVGRIRVAAWRESATVIGTLLALLIPAVVQISGGSTSSGLKALAITIAVALPLAALLAVWMTPEPVERSHSEIGFVEGLRQLGGNRPFLRLLAAFFINSLANGLPAALFLFFVGDRLGARDAAGPLLVVYFVSAIAGVPFWLWLARRTSKHRAWGWGMVMASVTFVAATQLGTGQVMAFAVVCVLTGLALGADVVMPSAIQADVIELDTAATGQERAGLFLGLWALATKLALAGAVGVAFPLLAYAGFDPASVNKPESGLLALSLLYAGAPVLLKLVAIALVWNFPLDRDMQHRAASQIAARTN
jgi:glycoside/pentoside/hexuronide:cation symporter, GPH family